MHLSIENNCAVSQSFYWSSEQILNADFIQGVVNSHVLEGIRTEVKCWRMHFRHHPDKASLEESRNSMKNRQSCPMITLVAEYRIGVFGERSPIIASNVKDYKKLIESEVDRMTEGTRKGAWAVSHTIPSSLLKL